MKGNEDRSGFWDGLGTGAIILAFCIGVGSCSMLERIGSSYKIEAAAKKVQP